MDVKELALDDRAALVAIIRRAARRGRQIREQNETAPGDEFGDLTPEAVHTPDLEAGASMGVYHDEG